MASSCVGVIPANPDISGVGVRVAIYIQNLLSFVPALYALLDGQISAKELETVEKQSTTILITAFAILISAIVQAATIGLSSFHTSIILNLSWMNNTNTFIYFILYIHHQSDQDRKDERVRPRWSAWRNHILKSFRSTSGSNKDAASNATVVRDEAASSRTTAFELVDERAEPKDWADTYKPLLRKNFVLVLGSLHLTVMAALGIWLWSSPSDYEWTQAHRNHSNAIPLHCTSTTLFGGNIHLESFGLQLVSLIIYSVFLPPALNLLLPIVLLLMLFMRYGPDDTSSGGISDTHTVRTVLPNEREELAFRFKIASRFMRTTWPILAGLCVLLVVNIVFIVDIEITLRRARLLQEDGETEWTFGQTLALLLLVLPIRDVYDYIRECAKAEYAQRCTQRLRESLDRPEPDFSLALRVAKHADDVRVHINDVYPSAIQLASFYGHVALVRLLLERKANINVDGGAHGTPLLASTSQAHSAVARLLVDHPADSANVGTSDRNGMTALHHAARHGLGDVTVSLIRHGADPKRVSNDGQTPLLIAVAVAAGNFDLDSSRWQEIIRLLLNHGADINQTRNDGCTALMLAIQNSHELTVQFLLEQGADVNATQEHFGPHGWTALFYAIQNGSASIVQLLVDHGADVNVSGSNGETPVILAAQMVHARIVRILLGKGANLIHLLENDETPLIYAARKGYECLVQVLLEESLHTIAITNGYNDSLTEMHPASEGFTDRGQGTLEWGTEFDQPDRNGATPLIHACEKGYASIVGLLLDRGVDVNRSRTDGLTSLLCAAEGGHVTSGRLLLEYHAPVNHAGPDGWTALIRAAFDGHEAFVRLLLEYGADINHTEASNGTALIGAAYNGHESITRLLLTHGAKVNHTKDNGSALSHAARHGHDQIAQLLLDWGADPNISDSKGLTPLIEAVCQDHESVVRLLLRHNVPVDDADSGGRTPLIHAAQWGRKRIMDILMEHHADLEYTSHSGWSALFYAVDSAHIAVVRNLIEQGVDCTRMDNEGRTALEVALDKRPRNEEIVQLLQTAAHGNHIGKA